MTTLRSIPDAYVSQAKSSTNYTATPTLGVSLASSKIAYPLLLPTGVPVGSDITIVSATLKVFNTAAWSGSVTLTAKQITSSWLASKVTYATMPTVTATGAGARTISGAAALTEWDIDITAIMQAWASGAANYGIRLETASTSSLFIHSADATGTAANYKPTIEVVWSGSPSTPTALNPDASAQVSIASPTLGWVYADPAGGTMQAYQVQMNTSNAFTSPAYDSGVVASSLPQHTLTVTVPVATPEWWRVRVQNAAGKWSAYSTPATFGRTAKGTVTLTTPSVGTPTMPSLTSAVAWTFTGTETKWRVYRPAVGNSAVILADSQEQSGTALAYTSPTAWAFAGAGGTEQVTVRVWDNVYRASTPGDPPYVEATQVATYAPGVISGGVVTSLVSTPDPVLPFVKLTWSRATAPDAFTIVRDGVAIATDVSAATLLVSGTNYAFTDVTASPRNSHTWRVDAVVANVASASSPTTINSVSPPFAWILDPSDPTWWIALISTDAGTWAMGEESAMYEVRGADRQVLVNEGLRGYEGTFSGSFYSSVPINGVTAQQMRNRVWDVKKAPTKTWRFVKGDYNIPVVLRNVSPAPVPGAELMYDLSFEFYQQGEVWF